MENTKHTLFEGITGIISKLKPPPKESKFYEKGILKAIGISNFYADRMVEFASFNRIKPMVNQVECHPLNQQIEAKKWNDKYSIQLEAWAPFGEGRGGLFENPVLKEIAAAHGKTTAQVMLRWHLQRGIVVIPKSTHKERMAENLNVFDFTLTAEEMAKITALDTATSSFFSHQDPAMVEWFVKMVEERKKQQAEKEKRRAAKEKMREQRYRDHEASMKDRSGRDRR